MSARVTLQLIESITASITPSPTTPTGAGVTLLLVETILSPPSRVMVTSVVIESIIAPVADQTHGDTTKPSIQPIYEVGV